MSRSHTLAAQNPKPSESSESSEAAAAASEAQEATPAQKKPSIHSLDAVPTHIANYCMTLAYRNVYRYSEEQIAEIYAREIAETEEKGTPLR